MDSLTNKSYHNISRLFPQSLKWATWLILFHSKFHHENAVDENEFPVIQVHTADFPKTNVAWNELFLITIIQSIDPLTELKLNGTFLL